MTALGRSLVAFFVAVAFSSLVPAQDGDVLLLVADNTPQAVKASLERGLKAGANPATVRTASPRALAAALKEKTPLAIVIYSEPNDVQSVTREGDKLKVPVIDLGHTLVRSKPVPFSQYADPAEEANCAAYWLMMPFAHFDVAVFAATSGPLQTGAKAFETAMKSLLDKRIVSTASPPSDAKSAAAALEKARAAGATAAYVCGEPAEVMLLAKAAKAMNPPLVVMASSSALGFGGTRREDPTAPQPYPDGTVIIARDLPETPTWKDFPEQKALFSQTGDSTFHELEAFDAGLAVARAQKAGAAAGADVMAKLADGSAAGLRGSLADAGKGETFGSSRLRYVPWIMDGGKLKPFPAVGDPEKPRARPTRSAYPTTGWNSFTQWNTGVFRADPGSTIVEFDWTDGKIRTIEQELATMKCSSGGAQPVVDHIIREKLMAQVLGVASEKFKRNRDGTAKSGESFNISLVHRAPGKIKHKQIWKAYVAGDDPEAGGRAFGTYCFIYSTFIYRTIFKGHELDEPLALADLDDLCLPMAEGDLYVAGTRRNVIYQIIVMFGGSMALTAAHEIGHLAGLGHDEKDPHSLMNVKEGAGIHHDAGFFIPEHCAIMEKTLGIVPKATKP